MIGETLGHYRVLHELGSGGMGDVYVAEDLKLGRRVALKVLPPEMRDSADRRERFEREARAVAALSHPNVLSIFEFGDDGTTSFAVTELLEGETLRERLDAGALPPREAVELAKQMAAGLAAAHERGIVHRDLKPENVFITRDGQLKILDFGLACWVEPESNARADEDGNESPTKGRFTEPGMVLGTVGYMSPEQVRGLGVDHRTDLFSFGAILYEMLSGRRAFTGATSADVMSAILRESPPELRLHEAESSRNLASIVERCLQKSVEARFQSARDLGFALQSLSGIQGSVSTSALPAIRSRLVSIVFPIAVALAMLLVGTTFWLTRNPETRDGTPEARPVVAVLLPENLTGDPANDFLSVGFADSLFTDLAGLPDVTVVPPSDVRAEAGSSDRDRREIARSLGASFVVDSSVQRAGSGLRINARLVSAEGDVVWRSDFAGDMAGIFDLQRRMAQGVAEGLQIRLSPEASSRLGPRAGADVDALTEYWRGRALLERPDRPEDVEAAVSAFEAALAIDADLAEAHAGLGEAYWILYSRIGDPSLVDRATEASERALALAPSQPRVWLTLALVREGTGRADLALDDLERAISLQPNGDDAYRLMGDVLSRTGSMEEALHAYDRAIERRPRYWSNHHRRGILLMRVGRHDEAKQAFETVTRLQPDSTSGYQALGTLFQITGDLEGARQNYEKALEIAPSTGSYSNLGTIHYWEGRYEDAAEAYRRAIELRPRNSLYHRNLGDTYTRLEQMQSAQASYGTAVSLLEQDLEVNPKDVVALTDLAVCMMKLGRLGRAEQHIEEALVIAPDDADVLYAQAIVTALAGRAEEALPILQRAVENGVSLYVVERDDDLASVRALPAYVAWLRSSPPP